MMLKTVKEGVLGGADDKIRQENPYHLLTLFAVFAIGFGCRLTFLFHRLANDECYTYVYYASNSLSFGLTRYCTNNHPLNTFLVNISTRIFGNAEWALRLPVFICGILTIPLVYIIIRKLYNKTAGLIATVFVSTSYMMVQYSTEARGYGIQAFLFLLLILTALYLKKNNTLRGWIAFGVIGVLGFYTLITNIYFFGAIVVWLFISAIVKDVSAERSVFMRNLVLASATVGVMSGLLYLPFVVVSGIGSLTGNNIVKPLAFTDFVKDLPGLFSFIYSGWSVDVWWPVFLTLGIGFLVSIIFHKTIARDQRVNLVLVIIGWCLLVLFVLRTLPYARVLFPLLPLFFGFASAGVWFMGHKAKEYVLKTRSIKPQPIAFNISIIGLTIILVIMVFVSRSSYGTGGILTCERPGMDCRKIAEVITENIQEGDMVYSNYFTVVGLSYYLERSQVPLSQLYGNAYGVPLISPESIKRIFVVLDLTHAMLPEIIEEYSNLDWNVKLDEPEENIIFVDGGFLFDIAIIPIREGE